MSQRLYLNHHVHSQITAGLRRRGVDVLTADEDGRADADDPGLLDRATEMGRVMFSQDRDFLVDVARRLRIGQRFAGVIYAHQLSVTVGQCVIELELMCHVYDPRDVENRVIYLPLRHDAP